MEPAVAAIFMVFLLIAGLCLKASFVGAAIWFELAYPDAAQRMLAAYRRRGRKTFVIGVVNLFVSVFVGFALLSAGPLAFFGMLLLIAIAIGVIVGYGVAYHDLGLRLLATPPVDTRASAILLGGILAETAFVVPILGQLLNLWVLFRGFGAVVSVLLSSRRRQEERVDRVEAAPQIPL